MKHFKNAENFSEDFPGTFLDLLKEVNSLPSCRKSLGFIFKFLLSKKISHGNFTVSKNLGLNLDL